MRKIYTKAGDQGRTQLGTGETVLKTDSRVKAYGTIDELSSLIGLAVAKSGEHEDVQSELIGIQRRLFVISSLLAFPGQGTPPGLETISAADIQRLELAIDRFSAELPPLQNFILPGGTPLGALLHVARSVCRRAERKVTDLDMAEYPCGVRILPYLNRLSDYLFTVARVVNKRANSVELPAQTN